MKPFNILLLIVTFPIFSFADCVVAEEFKCARIKVLKIVEQAKKGSHCVIQAQFTSDQSKLIKNVFFASCPKVGQSFTGNFVQRSDITVEQMAPCQLEFQEQKSCP